MEDHDVIVECAKYALEGQEKCWEDSKHQGLVAPSVRSRSGFELSGILYALCSNRPEFIHYSIYEF